MKRSIGEGIYMQLGVLLGLVGVLTAIALFLIHFISSALNTDDSTKIDPAPTEDFNQKM